MMPRQKGHCTVQVVTLLLGMLAVSETSAQRNYQIHPHSRPLAQAHLRNANWYDTQGRYAEAEAHYLLALSATPHDPDIYNNLGCSYYLSGRFDLAEQALRHSLQLRPNHNTAQANLRLVWAAKSKLRQPNSILQGQGQVAQATHAQDSEFGRDWCRAGEYYYTLEADKDSDDQLSNLDLCYKNLTHRAPFCGYYIELDKDQTVDLTQGDLKLHFSQVTCPVNVKFEIKDCRTPGTPQYMAFRRHKLCSGESSVISLGHKRPLDGLKPVHGWRRIELWPNWRRIQFLVVVVEARYNSSIDGSFRLERVEYRRHDGAVFDIPISANRIGTFEHTPNNVPAPVYVCDAPPEPRAIPEITGRSTSDRIDGGGDVGQHRLVSAARTSDLQLENTERASVNFNMINFELDDDREEPTNEEEFRRQQESGDRV